MTFINGYFEAVFIWVASGIFAIVLRRLSGNLIRKIKNDKVKSSGITGLIPDILPWIPIIIAVTIEWGDPYAVIAGFPVIFGFVLGIYPHELSSRRGIFIFSTLLAAAVLEGSGLASDVDTGTIFMVVASVLSTGYVVGDFTKRSRLIKE